MIKEGERVGGKYFGHSFTGIVVDIKYISSGPVLLAVEVDEPLIMQSMKKTTTMTTMTKILIDQNIVTVL